jgi:hypothetical protein
MFQSLLRFIAGWLGDAARFVIGRDPASNARLGGIAEGVGVDGEYELVVRVFEGRGVEDGGKSAGELLLVQVAYILSDLKLQAIIMTHLSFLGLENYHT